MVKEIVKAQKGQIKGINTKATGDDTPVQVHNTLRNNFGYLTRSRPCRINYPIFTEINYSTKV